MSLGNKLAEARRAPNLTQEQLAEKLEVTRQAVSRWESDAAYPETDKIVRMAQILEVSCDYLLQDGVDEKGAPVKSPVTGCPLSMTGASSRTSTGPGPTWRWW